MAHCPPEKLSDLKSVLSEIRDWEGIQEKSLGVFYLKRIPFLHFHIKDEKRWADVKSGKTWGAPVELPFDSSNTAKSKFLIEVKKRYQLMLDAKNK